MAEIIKKLVNYGIKNARLFSIILGTILISAWTLLRFFTKPSTFDLLGQQVLANQWLHGFHGGVLLGQTNYILKILLLYIPIDLLHISPRVALVFSTLFVNIVSFICIVLILERIYLLFNKRIPTVFYLFVVWLAVSAGSVFWIEYVNSRNIEVAAGLFLSYLLLLISKKTKPIKILIISIFAAIVFFADPLQLYMTTIPTLVFIGIEKVYLQRKKVAALLPHLIVIGAGVVISRMMYGFVETYLHVSFVLPSKMSDTTFISTVLNGFPNMLKEIIRLYDGGYELGRVVGAINIVTVTTLMAVGFWYGYRRLLSRRLLLLVVIIWFVDIAVFVLSRQAFEQDTSRYLIMTVPMFLLLATATVHAIPRKKHLAILFLSVLLVVNSLVLFSGVVKHWDTTFSKDNHLSTVTAYMQKNDFSYAYAGMYTAIPSTYFSSAKQVVLPLKCENQAVKVSYLDFDRAFYVSSSASEQKEVPVFLEAGAIYFPDFCGKDSIKKQLGVWQREDKLSDGSDVLIFDAQQLKRQLVL